MRNIKSRKRILNILLVISFFFISNITISVANIISAAYDSETHFLWANLSVSTGHSYKDLVGPGNDCNPTCTTGPFAGWTFAAESEVNTFMQHFGLSPYGSADPDTQALITRFIDLMGPTYDLSTSSSTDKFVVGITRSTYEIPDDDGLYVYAPGAYRIDCCGYLGTDDQYSGEFGPNPGNPNMEISLSDGFVGVWLYKVSEPSILALIFLGVLIASFFRQHHRLVYKPTNQSVMVI